MAHRSAAFRHSLGICHPEKSLEKARSERGVHFCSLKAAFQCAWSFLLPKLRKMDLAQAKSIGYMSSKALRAL